MVASPKSGEEVSSPLKITGVVNGNGWSGFEGQVGGVELLDSNGKLIASGPLTATTDWMKFPVNFETTLNFEPVTTETGTLVFHNENPSDMRDKDKTFVLPIKIAKSSAETISAKVYFGKASVSNAPCDRVDYVIRQIPKTQAVAKATIEELLKGPTDAEKAKGYVTMAPAGSKLNSISIINGEARADFNETTESGGGSCGQTALINQITKTLMQFPTITSVKLSINGRTGDIFQP